MAAILKQKILLFLNFVAIPINSSKIHLHAEFNEDNISFFSTLLGYEFSLSKDIGYRQRDGNYRPTF